MLTKQLNSLSGLRGSLHRLHDEPIQLTVETYSSEAELTSLTTKEIKFNFRPLVPEDFALSQNYPNPFNPSTIIEYQLPKDNLLTLKIYNLLGEEVTTLVNDEQKAGYYAVRWDASGFSSGVYFYRLQVGEFVEVNKLLLLR